MNLNQLKAILGTEKAARLGMAGPIVALVGIFISIALSPDFTWTGHALSDLGVWEYGVFFNTGLIICGVFSGLFVFGLFLNTDRDRIITKIGYFILVLASITLSGIGLFTLDYDPIHFYFSVAFFVLILLAYLILGLSMIGDKETRSLGILAIIFSVMGVIGWSIHWGDGIAIPEAITSIPAAIWIFILAKTYYNKYNNFKIIIEPMDDDNTPF